MKTLEYKRAAVRLRQLSSAIGVLYIRKPNGKPCSHAGFAFTCDFPLAQFKNPFDDGQPQSASLFRMGGISLIKFIKNALLHILIHPDAVIFDLRDHNKILSVQLNFKIPTWA